MSDSREEFERHLLHALADIESCAWGLPGYDTPEEAANWMHDRASKALSEARERVNGQSLMGEPVVRGKKKPIAYTNWVHIQAVQNGEDGSMYPDSKDAPIALYTDAEQLETDL